MTQAPLTCGYHVVGLCRSCTALGVPYEQQVADKDARVRSQLADHVPADAWRSAATGPDRAFRNKAKLAIGGTSARPTLGITDAAGHGIDLRECAVHAPEIWQIIPDLAGFITLTGLEPYDVATRRGGLKFIIVTCAPDGQLMLRFVLRTPENASLVRAHLPALLRRLPQVMTVSANLHPEHKAVLEGEEEIALHGPTFFPFRLAERTLFLRHRSFFQTNTTVAEQLYDQAAQWARALDATAVLDLYCGVGGFAVHLAAPGRRVHGVEIEPDAVEAARRAVEAYPGALGEITFAVGDATTALRERPEAELVVVNPPRRGLGESLCADLEASTARYLIYSSCNPTTLASDLARLPSWEALEARLFNMFPQTDHSEVAVLLQRSSDSVTLLSSSE